MLEDPNLKLSLTRYQCRVISVLFPYAISLEQGGEQGIVDALSCIAKATRPYQFMWYPVKPFIAAMFNKPDPPSLNWVLGLISPHLPWHNGPHDGNMVARQVAAIPAALNSEKVHWSVADELLHIAFIHCLQPEIPNDFPERPGEIREDIICQVRALGDLGVLRSYLLLVWSKWGLIDGHCGGLAEMQASIQEEFNEIGVDRQYLIKHLEYVLKCLKYHNGLQQTQQEKQAMEQYRGLERVLLEVEETVNRITRKSATVI